jgi:hypothetical protein
MIVVVVAVPSLPPCTAQRFTSVAINPEKELVSPGKKRLRYRNSWSSLLRYQSQLIAQALRKVQT